MYGGVVMQMKPQTKEDIDPFEQEMETLKEEIDVELDTHLDTDHLKKLVQ